LRTENPTIAVEFWDGEDLVVARFRPDGTADAYVQEGTNSQWLLEHKGGNIAQISLMTEEKKTDDDGRVYASYHRVGEMEPFNDERVQDAVMSMLLLPEMSYAWLHERVVAQQDTRVLQ